jgi:hypothetical protein
MKQDPPIDWNDIDAVAGTRTDIFQTGIKRPCMRCGVDTFTSQPYPAGVSFICEVCIKDDLPDLGPKGPTPAGEPSDAELAALVLQYGIKVALPLPHLEAEAAERGVSLHRVVRDRLIARLKAKGVLGPRKRRLAQTPRKRLSTDGG